jgi:UDP-glucose 4-epimerase
MTDSWRHLSGPALVVGGGFIGMSIAASIASSGIETRMLTRVRPSSPALDGREHVTLLTGDANDAGDLAQAVKGVSHLFWCVGGPMPAESEHDPVRAIESRCRPLALALDALDQRRDTEVVLFSSGGTVYGDAHDGPVSESDLTEPMTAYGISSLCAELLVRRNGRLTSRPVLILRCGNLYGVEQPANRSQGLIATAMSAARGGTPLTLFGDGSAVRDYIHIDDLAPLVGQLAGRPDVPTVVNIGTQTGSSITEVIASVERVSGRAITLDRRDARSADIRSVVLDTSLARSLTTHVPLSLDAGIRRTWEGLLSTGDRSPG